MAANRADVTHSCHSACSAVSAFSAASAFGAICTNNVDNARCMVSADSAFTAVGTVSFFLCHWYSWCFAQLALLAQLAMIALYYC